jgi:hypothetical protein
LLIDSERERRPLTGQTHDRAVGTRIDLQLRKCVEIQKGRRWER